MTWNPMLYPTMHELGLLVQSNFFKKIFRRAENSFKVSDVFDLRSVKHGVFII